MSPRFPVLRTWRQAGAVSVCPTKRCWRRLSGSRKWQRNCSRTLRDFMVRTTKNGLVQAAAEARERAVAPYSKFKVGAALLAKSGEIITGANVESASYGPV